MDTPRTIVWFREDLRVQDNPALAAAARRGCVLPVFVAEQDEPALGGATKWWLHHSLTSLDQSLGRLGSRLIVREGDACQRLLELADETGATAVYWNRRYTPAGIQTDSTIKQRLRESGLDVESFNGRLLREPWHVETKTGGFYKVFTPFWKALLRQGPPSEPLEQPKQLDRVSDVDPGEIGDLDLLPSIDWAGGIEEQWTPGERGAHDRLERFLADVVATYHDTRNLPDRVGSSRLSPHLRFGEISPRQIWHAAVRHAHAHGLDLETGGIECFLREVGWREFAYHLLYHVPETVDSPLRDEFRHFPWSDDPKPLRRWQKGQTGYPIVDAGMRELWTTGWMHNRVRMIVASFLIKDLMIPWQRGAEWFWDTLVDADLASNTLGWQWTAGCGADAAPYFRIFNPVSQGEKFDSSGTYVRRWVPEIARLPDRYIHKPWLAPASVRDDAGLMLGTDYPFPMVDHAEARRAALAAYDDVRAMRA